MKKLWIHSNGYVRPGECLGLPIELRWPQEKFFSSPSANCLTTWLSSVPHLICWDSSSVFHCSFMNSKIWWVPDLLNLSEGSALRFINSKYLACHISRGAWIRCQTAQGCAHYNLNQIIQVFCCLLPRIMPWKCQNVYLYSVTPFESTWSLFTAEAINVPLYKHSSIYLFLARALSRRWPGCTGSPGILNV